MIKIFHTGDWKIDESLILEVIRTAKFIEIGSRGIDTIVCDSTNANVQGFSGSEFSLEKQLSKIKDLKKESLFLCLLLTLKEY